MIPSDFQQFFRELHDKNPFPWQRQLAERVATAEWPKYLGLPTASGKTACIEIALFALAYQADRKPAERAAACRIFFVVDRRVIVDEAFKRAEAIAEKLRLARDGVLKDVADRLRKLSGDAKADPLDVYELRGGVYRDHSWVRSPAQPTVITSTVDQVGSRLVFRGYGVSHSSRPIHAALIACDSLIILDEAHCSEPFSQTLRAVARYLHEPWAAKPLRLPFRVVQMTATPPPSADPTDVFTLGKEDLKTEHLGERLFAAKPTRLIEAGKRPGKESRAHLADVVAREASQLVRDYELLQTVAVFVNRVRTAREVAERLRKESPESRVELVTGRMRPVDRDQISEYLQTRLKSGATRFGGERLFVVSTQCLEVGADFDFDGLVTECASIDALRQRFGRLNRMGRRQDNGRPFEAQAVIVLPGGKIEDDPVYGEAIANTWQWLCEQADGKTDIARVNFAIRTMAGDQSVSELLDRLRITDHDRFRSLHGEMVNAPVLLPGYLDSWVQTAPEPQPDPDIALFLHGAQRDNPDVQVVWRADLGPDEKHWAQIVSLCPPSAAECMPVPISALRKWLRGEENAGTIIADIADMEVDEEAGRGRAVLIWRGIRKSEPTHDPGKIRPGDTVVIPERDRGWESFGYIPEVDDKKRKDKAEEAFLQAKRKVCLRLHPDLMQDWPDAGTTKQELLELLSEQELDFRALGNALQAYAAALEGSDIWQAKILGALRIKSARILPYPDSRGVVFQSRIRSEKPEEDSGDDENSAIGRRVALEEHTENVLKEVERSIETLALHEFAGDLTTAARLHDWGKADKRFQALLLGGDRFAAEFSSRLWGKSDSLALSKQEREWQRQRSHVPIGFRHELASLELVQSGKCNGLPKDADLVLHLVASHHGLCRPFAPVILDEEPPDIDLSRMNVNLSWSAEERKSMIPAHRLGSGVAERFWKLTRRFGWWGLAYLEAVFRLADWSASEHEREQAERQEVS